MVMRVAKASKYVLSCELNLPLLSYVKLDSIVEKGPPVDTDYPYHRKNSGVYTKNCGKCKCTRNHQQEHVSSLSST